MLMAETTLMVAATEILCRHHRERERRQDEFRHQVTNVATNGADGITPSSVTYQRHVIIGDRHWQK
ncbi:hypothetical protein C0Q70_09230 [Pomacea canaliculata]|uniref:Uncharacterized protein n=1 Tax=Pomacea canaliculata TaxID=400727 RepID=A0A2T7P980_POMCA|nr:hypothetical protein C0Q70_09230 [Pomacea canaliculata]